MSSTSFTSLSGLPDFDPRTAPVIGVDVHLPKVDLGVLDPESLLQRFLNPPPWAPETSNEDRWVLREPVHAAVLVPLVMRDQLTVLLTQRSTRLSNHSGQISFPGGRIDASDTDARAAALRETHEEVGIDPQLVSIIGTLPSYTTGSAFIITPVVGLVRQEFQLQPNSHEVEEVFEVPLPFLMDPAHHRRHRLERGGVVRNWYSMPYQDQGRERFIWGATAGMLRNLYHFLAA